MDLAESVLAGNRLALARLLTLVENDTPEGRVALNALFPHTGQAHLIGVTGSPGTGKSSLVNQLARALRKPEDGSAPRRVAIIAVDPSSPFTGGAILGDRVRMRDLSGDTGVFIRSMATRGALGGLARTTATLSQVFDAAGFDIVLIETVGAGQSEVDIARLAHTTLVVEAPGMGDDIQAIKAGILEIADILVLNKADHAGVENAERALRSNLEMAQQPRPQNHTRQHTPGSQAAPTQPETPGWVPPILRTVAPKGQGISAVLEAIQKHAAHLRESGLWQQREQERLQSELDLLVQAALVERWRATLPAAQYNSVLRKLNERSLSPFQALEILVKP
ncbi:MAG TPA: methylmalonyl Co-A mutase-associated GTPase MeaB [Anaerolineaceae bacterium]|nr:methylmalonyl Co-A mutase-associated GTPase MeaB [Anaerolineaceae bacterium]